jgi:hypothetical protein
MFTASWLFHSCSEILACLWRGKPPKDDHHSSELKAFRNHLIRRRIGNGAFYKTEDGTKS